MSLRAWVRSYGWAPLWLFLTVAAVLVRPLLPLDETRYLGVAWEMWLSGNLLVPHLNAEPYSHKPPILFWLINAVWQVAGTSEFAARMVAPAMGLFSLFFTRLVALRLWREDKSAAEIAPWVLVATLLFVSTTTLSMFDTLVALFALVAIHGLVTLDRGANERSPRALGLGAVLIGVGIGLGVLSKGPVILVFVLPALLLAPLWRRGGGWLWWAAGGLGGVATGVAIALLWALPAAAVGGPEFERAIFWGQTSDRVAGGFSHARPFWWYLPALGVVLIPWVLWPRAWRALRNLSWRDDIGLRLVTIWAVGAVVVLSLFTDKQPHYLLPAMPAAALVLARGLANPNLAPHPADSVLRYVALTAGILLVAGAAILATGWIALPIEVTLRDLAPLGAAGVLACLLAAAGRKRSDQVRGIAVAMVVIAVALHSAVVPALAPLYDLRRVAEQVARLQAAARPIAFVGKYHNQFHFLGRLRQPLATIDGDQVAEWFERNPGGYAIYLQRGAIGDGARPLMQQPFRSRTLAIWDQSGALADPGRFKR
jgi:4-amino-4-deoxy-L-arabinose transferase-like glycosyltransferase